MNQKEKLFFDQLKDIFIGVKIEGESGFINLMRIKSAYFDVIFKELNKEIEEETKDFPDFKEEMFDKLYTFFKTYFSESGSIYFNYTPLKSKVYERIYSPNRDVILFWKTHMLYYVKTDRLWNNLTIDFDENGVRYKINFDVSKLQHKKANEKREIIYELKEIKDREITFNVLYSERGRKTKSDEILRAFRKENIHLDEERLLNLFRTYEKQNEVDYFINKNAEQFLKEQFDLWLKNYLFDDESDFSEKRLKQLKVLKEIAYKVIDFVAQFEDELVKIWNKPKFVLNSNYVITLDRIAKKDGGIEFIEKIVKHKGFEEQKKEWKDLGILDELDESKLFINTLNGKELSKEFQFLPIDTKYFDEDIKLELLSLFDDLDKELDGWLIHSENYQALKTVLPKFREKVQTIYIDPPFNKEQDADYFYSVKYKDATWITLLENRLHLARDV
ncbi:MAG: site-specific DNA-methyltransferase, partial [Candidatus Desulfofervidus sp.]|nr:site-specific DNA-methyltransferase [Candidatus Desulfofervidus sp.]